MLRFRNRIFTTFICVAYVWVSSISGAAATTADDLQQLIFGAPFTLSVASVLPEMPAAQAAEFQDALKGLVAPLKDIENGKQPTKPSDDQARAQIKSLRESLNKGREALNSFKAKVARGEFDEMPQLKSFVAKCNDQLDQKLKDVDQVTRTKVPESGSLKINEQPPSTITQSSFQDLQKCRGEATKLVAELEARSQALEEQLNRIDAAIDQNDKDLQNGKIDQAKHDQIKKQLEKQRDTAKKEKDNTDDAKKGVNVWLVVLGVLSVIAGIVLICCYDILDAWTLIATGIGLIGEGLGSKGGDQANNAPPADANGAQGNGTGTSTKVNEGSAAGKPNQDTTEVEKEYKDKGYTAVPPSTPGGNLVLFLNPATKEVVVARADNKAETVRIPLKEVKVDPVMWPSAVHPWDLTGASSWSISTVNGFVKLSLLGKFPASDIATGLIEDKETGKWIAITEIAPAPITAAK